MKFSIKFFLIVLFLFLSIIEKIYPQWEYAGVFPDPLNPEINQTGGIHGLAVDPDGKLWVINYYAYQRDLIYVQAVQGYIPVTAVYVFNPDGTQASFSPIKFITINGVTDTLGGFTNSSNIWEARTGRGMKMAPDGNIVVTMFDTYYKINYITGEGIRKVTPSQNVTATAPSFSGNGHMFTASVLPGNPVKEFDHNFNFISNVLPAAVGFSRGFEVGRDGLTLYWAGYNNHCIYKYTRPDINSSFTNYDIILPGFDAESFSWYPDENVLWVSAGSGMDLPNMYPGTTTYYSYCTWYAYDITTNSITDSIKWQNLIDPYWQRPRAITFSHDGNTAYVGMFGDTFYDGIQKFIIPAPVHVLKPNGGEYFHIGYTDTIKWNSTVSNVKLEYSTNSGTSWNLILNSVPASAKKYNWTIPDAPSENCLVKITDASVDSVYDVSDNVFTISHPPVISVLPDSFYFIVDEGDSTESVLHIANTGQGNLLYEIAVENSADKSKSLKRNFSGADYPSWNKFFPEEKTGTESYANVGNKFKFSGILPLIVSDPKGDAQLVDITEIRGKLTSDSVLLQLVFETVVYSNDFGGILGLDVDENVSTGTPMPFASPGQQLGCEYFISISTSSGIIYLYDEFGNIAGYFPLFADPHNIWFSVPFSFFAGDDGIMNIAAVVGNSSAPTDWIPDAGYGTLGGVAWLTVEPASGLIIPGNNSDHLVKIKTDKLDGGSFQANIKIMSNDPLHPVHTIPVGLNVIGKPHLTVIDSVNFGQVFTGYPDSVILELKNTGSVSLEISALQFSNGLFSAQGPTVFTISPGSIYPLRVKFSPVAAGSVIAALTIQSNDPSSPAVILLFGEGVFPPAISVTPDSFYYNLNVGDSVKTQLTINNTNGLGELNFRISDRLTQPGKKVLTQSRYLTKKAVKEFHSLEDFLRPEKMRNPVKKLVSSKNEKEENKLNLPVIIRDKTGDGGLSNIFEIRGQIINDNLEMEYVFAENTLISDSILAVIFLDIDRNPATGIIDTAYFHDLGVEFQLLYFPMNFGNQLFVYNLVTYYSYYVPYVINGTVISFSIPLSVLDNDDGEMDLLAMAGHYSSAVTDWAPDAGHATLYTDAVWLIENPVSGTVPPGGNLTIQIAAYTQDLIGGNYYASIDIFSNDPDNPYLEIPFNMKLTGIPRITLNSDSLDFGKTYIGYYNSSFLEVSNNGTDTLTGNIVSAVSQFVIPDPSFTLQVCEVKNIEIRFYPDNVGNISSQLTINSNTPSSPDVITVKGKGVIAPNIATGITQLEFQSAQGDTIDSSFKIYNTGGSILNVEITDEVTDSSGMERLFSAGNNTIYELNPENGQVINSFTAPVYGQYSAGLAYSGKYLYFSSPETSPNIFVLDPANGNIIKVIPSHSYYCDGLAFVNKLLYAQDGSVINVLNPENGNVVMVLYPSVYTWGGLDGGDNRLFASSANIVYELDPANGNVIRSFSTTISIQGIAFMEKRLLVSDPYSGTDEYDPETGNFVKRISYTGYTGLAGNTKSEAPWLIENPSNVAINANDSTEINICILANQNPGNYKADIILTSNDPDLAELRIPVIFTIITGAEEENNIPEVYSLYNNYPNPFNPLTTISYDMPENGFVVLKVYNINGEEIATLVNEEQNVGRYKIQWNASSLASGIYFYRITAGSFVEVKKMILLK